MYFDEVIFVSDKEFPNPAFGTPSLPSKKTTASLPHPLDAEWNVRIDEENYGPFSGHDLKSMATEGRLDYDSMVQKVGGSGNWIEAKEDRALAKFFIPVSKPASSGVPSVSASKGAQVITVNNHIGAPIGYFGERPVDKTPFVAAIFSLLLCGVGQMYNGQVGKGIMMMIACIFLWAVMLGWIINIWAIVDAYSVAKRKHEAYGGWMEANAAAARAQAAG